MRVLGHCRDKKILAEDEEKTMQFRRYRFNDLVEFSLVQLT